MAEFPALLRAYREESHLSQRALAQITQINQAILSRLESGDRGPSGAEQVLAIARALSLDRSRTDALLSSAGYWPQALIALGPADETLLAVARVLSDEAVPQARKQRFRRLVELLAEEWTSR